MISFNRLLIYEIRNILGFRGLWMQVLWLNLMLLLVFGLSTTGTNSLPSLLALFWVMLLSFYYLLMPLAYRHDLAIGRLDQLRLISTPFYLMWAKMLSAMLLLFIHGLVLLVGFVVFLGFEKSVDFILFYLVSIPGMVALCHFLDLVLLQEKESHFLLSLVWLPNALPSIVLSYLYVLSQETSALYYALALSFFWLAVLPGLQMRSLSLYR